MLYRAIVTALAVFMPGLVWADITTSPNEPLNQQLNVADQARSGAFSYSIPIDVPRGRGPTPSIAITYNSLQGNGIAGVGWTITGIPAIVRSQGDYGAHFDWANYSADTYRYLPNGWGTPESSGNTILPVNRGGVTTPQVSHNFLQHQVTTGSPMLDFRSYEACGQQGMDQGFPTTVGGPCYWTALDGHGNTYYFGGDSHFNAAQYPAGSTTVSSALWEPRNGVTQNRGLVVWSLYKVVDRAGNYYQIDYVNNGQTLYPAAITYNLPLAGATARSLCAGHAQ
jgi:hypothetical protein